MGERRTARLPDGELKKAIAAGVFSLIEDHAKELGTPGAISVNLVQGLGTDLSAMLRVRVDHGGARGQKYHFYTLKISETTT